MVEIRDFAFGILSNDTLEGKLETPLELTDENPGAPLFFKEPARSHDLRFQKRKKEEKLPPLHELKHQDKRAICLHRFAGHELLAVEIMAYTLLAFPDAPASFRKGLAYTLKEEQEHVRLYCKRLNELGVSFGSMPIYKHFWSHTPAIKSPLHYVSTMSLTLEMANLDFAPIYGKAFLKGGDEKSADLMARILNDEIAHVGFGLKWLRNMKPSDLSEWDVWTDTLRTTLLTPRRAKGPSFHSEPREKAGVSKEWIQQLREFSLAPSQSAQKLQDQPPSSLLAP
jgi:uncharacterized ferritin-like protein (DUF455 family)